MCHACSDILPREDSLAKLLKKDLTQVRAEHIYHFLCWFSFSLFNIHPMRSIRWSPASTSPMASDCCINSIPDTLPSSAVLWFHKLHSLWWRRVSLISFSFYFVCSTLSLEIFTWFNLANFFYLSSHKTVSPWITWKCFSLLPPLFLHLSRISITA